MQPTLEQIVEWFKGLQGRICQALEEADGGSAHFGNDNWQRQGGGGGLTRTLAGGQVVEKGGVAFSHVHGEVTDKMRRSLGLEGEYFHATGVSLVQHPRSPRVPISHMNVRYFELDSGLYWFGGGMDITPIYVDEKQADWFHAQLRQVCQPHHPDFYTWHSAWARQYFLLRHRGETRGVGGTFFDRLSDKIDNGNGGPGGLNKAGLWAYVQAMGNAYAPIYTDIINQNQALAYGERELEWQRLRRGRYVEFNLVWDAGTKFGLETNGRTESILMSLPPIAQWEYDYTPEPGSEEEMTLNYLKSQASLPAGS